jgi:parallel beta-helix repeat protein
MKRKGISILFAVVLVVSLSLVTAVPAAAATTWTVDDDGVECATADFTHPQDAVNAASPGDTVLVYPGVYRERVYTSPKPPHWGKSDQYAPPLIVWKDNLTIKAVEGPANTTIECSTEYNFWVNKYLGGGGGGGSIERSTGGVWDPVAKVFNGDCVRPKSGTAPNAVAIIASGVTIDGFTIHRPYDWTDGTYNTAGVMIGGLYAGYGGAGESLGHNNNVVQNCVFSDVWHAVYIWHSSGNQVLNNTVAALSTNHWAAISAYDGYNDAQIGLGNLSENNLIAHNTLSNKGIALGAWEPLTWTSNAGSKVCCNTVTQVGVTYSHGPVMIGCNTGGFWEYETDKVIRIKGITYTGNMVFPAGAVELTAQLAYDGSADGSGVEVVFNMDGTDYSAATLAGGAVSTQVTLDPGVYTIETKVTVCDCCRFSDEDFLAIYDPAAGFVTGGGWIESAAGAYAADVSLTGKATFGFVSKYQKGASIPEGNTEFVFRTAGLNFHSSSYDWLVVTGSDYARFKGTGTINGAGEYKFMLWAGDGIGTDGADTFRIKIWEEDESGNETVIYDNGMNQAIGGGSIVVHTK